MTSLLTALLLALAGGTHKTEVIFLGELPAERAIALWERVLGPETGALVVPGKSPDMIVVRDTPERLTRFRALLDALGGASASERIYVRPVVHLLPSELATLLEATLAEGAPPRGERPPVFVPDDRSGRLVVRATARRYQAIDRLARALDVPAHGPSRRVIGVEPEPPGGLP